MSMTRKHKSESSAQESLVSHYLFPLHKAHTLTCWQLPSIMLVSDVLNTCHPRYTCLHTICQPYNGSVSPTICQMVWNYLTKKDYLPHCAMWRLHYHIDSLRKGTYLWPRYVYTGSTSGKALFFGCVDFSKFHSLSVRSSDAVRQHGCVGWNARDRTLSKWLHEHMSTTIAAMLSSQNTCKRINTNRNTQPQKTFLKHPDNCCTHLLREYLRFHIFRLSKMFEP